MGKMVVPGIDFFQDLCVIGIVIAHQWTIFDGEAFPPECQVSNRGGSVWRVSRWAGDQKAEVI